MAQARCWPRRTPAGQGQQPDAGQGHQRAGRLGGAQGRTSSTRWSRPRSGGVTADEQVDDARHGDGARRPSPDPAGPAADGAEVGRRWPRRPVGVGGHHHGMGVVDLAVAGRDALEDGGRGAPTRASSKRAWSSAPVSSSTQASCWQCQEDREHPEAAGVLLHDLAGRAGAGEEPGAEMGELGLQGGPGDEPGVAVAAQRPRRRRGRRRWPWRRPRPSDSSKSPSSRPPPRVRHAWRATKPSTTARTTISTTQTTAATSKPCPPRRRRGPR